MERIALPMISRRDLPSGLPSLKYSSRAPGAATTSKGGLGREALSTLRTAIWVRPPTSRNLMSPSYSGGRNFVNASVVSYMWLSTSNTGKSRTRDAIGYPFATSLAARACTVSCLHCLCAAREDRGTGAPAAGPLGPRVAMIPTLISTRYKASCCGASRVHRGRRGRRRGEDRRARLEARQFAIGDPEPPPEHVSGV